LFDIVSVGHFCIDSILLPGKRAPFVVLGGSATYVSFAARCLGARVAVVSKVGSDFPEAYRWWLEQDEVNLSNMTKVENSGTTRFELRYTDDLTDRTLTLKNRAPPITLENLTNHLKSDIIHVAPIAGEVEYGVVEKLKKVAKVLSLDPQGLMRSFDDHGKVSLCPMSDRRILELVNIYKSSLDELKVLTGLSDVDLAIKTLHDQGVEIVMVTLGMKGSVLSFDGFRYDIPSCVPVRIVDPTGAGDAFMGGFLAEYVNGSSILRCACVGSAAASFVVEGIGPTFFGDKLQIYQRARELYEKGIKQ
jgi:sugar/nucleoside kinase (ribokinase family)